MAVVEFQYTGSFTDWTVPAGVTSLLIEAYGAQGTDSTFGAGGKGGTAHGTLAVTPGESLRVTVGGRNGFGGGGAASGTGPAGSGGGASDVRQGGTALANRKIVAGGGGGGAALGGGEGGGTTGGDGYGSRGGLGGTASAGGAGRASDGSNASGVSGALGAGGDGGIGLSQMGGGGGGGGYYGGGGGSGSGAGQPGGGGGGGSGYVGGVTSAATSSSTHDGDGAVTFAYDDNRTVLAPNVSVQADTSGAAIDISAIHPTPDPDENVAVDTIAVHRQESDDGAVWAAHGAPGVVDGYDVLADGLPAAATFTDWRVANAKLYRYRVVATGTNGTTATGVALGGGWYAGSHAADGGDNAGWVFEDAPTWADQFDS